MSITYSADIQTSVDIEIDTSIYCGLCGAGICHSSTVEVVKEYIKVTATCENCQETIDNLTVDNDELQAQINKLEKEIELLKLSEV